MAIIKIGNPAIDLDAAEIPNLSANKITSGTFDNARISLDAAEIPNLDTAKITTGTLADARVPDLNASKITAGTIATARLGSGTANSSTFLRGDNTFAEAGGGITEADQWRLTTGFTGDATALQNLERVDTSGWGKIGTGMSESAGIFTFPSTGIWFVKFRVNSVYNGANRYCTGAIQVTTNNSSYANIASSEQGIVSEGNGNVYANTLLETLIDCTNTSNVKVRFNIDNESNSTTVVGDTNVSYTGMMFIRLGDT